MTSQTLTPSSPRAPVPYASSASSFLQRALSPSLLKATAQEWSRDKASRLAAALAYYTATALAQLLIGILAIAGFIYSTEQAQQLLVAQANRFVGAQGAEIVQTIVSNADQPQLARLAGILTLLLLLWSGSNIIVQLQEALNTAWGVELRNDLPFVDKVKRRVLPVLAVAGVGLLVLLATFATATLSAAGSIVNDLLPGGALVWQIVNYLLTLAIIALAFALIFKLLPDVKIAWRDVWPGAILTALLFMVGQLLLGWYLGRQSGSSVYGAAGSLIVLLLWIYYSAQIFLFGAEYTQVYATRYGSGVRPDDDAVPRGSQMTPKPLALATQAKSGQAQPLPQAAGSAFAAHDWRVAVDTPQTLGSLGRLATNLLDDTRTLARQEMSLARAEMREMFARVQRGALLSLGGGLMLYAAAVLVFAMVALVLQLIMPLWLAVFLVGLLLVIEGWLLTLAGRRRLDEAATRSQLVSASLRNDVETIKEHVTNS